MSIKDKSNIVSIRKEIGLRPHPIKYQKKLMEDKLTFLKQQEEKESKKLIDMMDKHYPIGGTPRLDSRFSSRHWPDENDVVMARHDHKCFHSTCKKTMKKGNFYFRRSFGRMWTIKACSIECFCWCLP